MSFRQYGGINYAARNNIVKNNFTNANNLSVMSQIGQTNSTINVQSGLYLTSDITFEYKAGPYYSITYSDGTVQNTAKRTTDTYWQPIDPSASTPPIYYTNKVLIGPNPDNNLVDISGNAVLGINGGIGVNGNIYSGTTDLTTGKFTNNFMVDASGNVDMSGNLVVAGTTNLKSTLNVSGSTTLNNTLTVNNNDATIHGITVGLGGGTGLYNTACGATALFNNTSGGNNTACGEAALFNNTAGTGNTAVGQSALQNNTTGFYNTAVGQSALSLNTGTNNTACGTSALVFNTTGGSNTACGLQALYYNTTGGSNTAIGQGAGVTQNQSNNNNTYLGSYTDIDLSANSWSNSTAIGSGAKITASNQIVLGTTTETVYIPGVLSVSNDATIHGITVGLGSGAVLSNTACGYYALTFNTTGFENTACGYYALQNNTTGNSNTACGYYALHNTTSNYNTACGYYALRSNTIGYDNTAVGVSALNANTTGNYNTACGYYALYANTTGIYNTAVGISALQNNTGNYNTSLGVSAGQKQTTNSNNTFLGSYTDLDYSTNSWSNSTAIGYGAKITASNQIVLGTSAETIVVPGYVYSSYGKATPVTISSLVSILFTDFLPPLTGAYWYFYSIVSDVYTTNVTSPYYNSVGYIYIDVTAKVVSYSFLIGGNSYSSGVANIANTNSNATSVTIQSLNSNKETSFRLSLTKMGPTSTSS